MLPPEGYDRIVGVLLEDGTIVPERASETSRSSTKKQDGIPRLPRAMQPGSGTPCILAIKRLKGEPSTEADDVLRFRLLLDSDPKFAPR